jgi:hypothetical protein
MHLMIVQTIKQTYNSFFNLKKPYNQFITTKLTNNYQLGI